MAQSPAGFVPDAPTAALPAGFTPDRPDFRAENEKDAAGQAVVTDWVDKLAGWLPAIGGTVGGVVGTAGGPIGAIGGAAFGGMAGEAYKELIARARGRQAPGTMTEAAKDMAISGGEQGAAQVVGEVAGPAIRAIGGRIMQSAIKPGLKTLLRGTGEEMQPVVKTMLDEGLNVSANGVKKLQTLLTSTKQDVANAIQQAGAQGAEISPLRVASRLSDTARKFANQVNPQADLEAVSQVGQNFLDAHGAQDLTLPEAQALKVGTYRVLRQKFGQMGPASTEAEKALARGLKEELETAVPGISSLNEREASLLQTLSEVGKRAALAGNRDPVGFAWVAHNPTMFLAALIDRNPALKSLIARGLYNHAGQLAQVPPALIRGAVHALATDDPQAGIAAGTTDQGHPR